MHASAPWPLPRRRVDSPRQLQRPSCLGRLRALAELGLHLRSLKQFPLACLWQLNQPPPLNLQQQKPLPPASRGELKQSPAPA